jgi:hypothetical protein
MRESLLFGIVVVAAFLGWALEKLLLPNRLVAVAPKIEPVVTVVPKPAPLPVPETPAPEVVDPNSSPEAVHAWRREDKDALEARVEKLSNDQVEFLCFVLQLIPRDEVFDKINVKGRLIRHIDDMRMAGEFADVEMAFRELDEHR